MGGTTKQSVFFLIVYRQVPRKPRRAGGDESAQLKNNKNLISGMDRAVRGEHHLFSVSTGTGADATSLKTESAELFF